MGEGEDDELLVCTLLYVQCQNAVRGCPQQLLFIVLWSLVLAGNQLDASEGGAPIQCIIL